MEDYTSTTEGKSFYSFNIVSTEVGFNNNVFVFFVFLHLHVSVQHTHISILAYIT